ncbi:hypothetical protein [Rhodopila sp.]|uniref:hypothetical protein n=1 Tax=Rhodopila sp. TaxID=2480087 RepID=UPI003D10C7B1
MELHDLIASDVLLEMAYTQKKAERIITALEKPINDHLLRLWTMPAGADRELWIRELINWIDEIAEIVLRPANTRPPHIFYYKLLFFEPFGGGAGRSNILRRLRRQHRQGCPVQIDVTPEALLDRLQGFHRDLSGLCAEKTIGEEQIRRFLDEH